MSKVNLGFMKVSDRFKVGITRYQPTDAEELAAFQLESFGEGTRQVDPARRTWLFEQNPCIDADGPGVWICRRNDAIVGQQAEIPYDLRVGDDERRAAWAVDLMVDPDWRLKGVGPGLVATQLEGRTIVGGLNLSEKGFATYSRGGWTDLGIVPAYFRPLDAKRTLAVAPVPAKLRKLAPVAGPALRVADEIAAGATRATGARLVPVDRFDERVDQVWADASPHYPVLARRDLAALSWRVDQRPDASGLRRYYLVRGGRTVGYVVLRPTTWSDEAVVVVVDYLAPPRWVAPLLLAAGQAARREGAVTMLAKTRNEQADRWLRATGFVRREQATDSPIRFMVHCTDDDPVVCELVSRPENWFVTSTDSDLEYATVAPAAEGS